MPKQRFPRSGQGHPLFKRVPDILQAGRCGAIVVGRNSRPNGLPPGPPRRMARGLAHTPRTGPGLLSGPVPDRRPRDDSCDSLIRIQGLRTGGNRGSLQRHFSRPHVIGGHFRTAAPNKKAGPSPDRPPVSALFHHPTSRDPKKPQKPKPFPSTIPPDGRRLLLVRPVGGSSPFLQTRDQKTKTPNLPKTLNTPTFTKNQNSAAGPDRAPPLPGGMKQDNPRTRKEPQNDRTSEACFHSPGHPKPDRAGIFHPGRGLARPFARHNGSATGVPGSPAGSAFL